MLMAIHSPFGADESTPAPGTETQVLPQVNANDVKTVQKALNKAAKALKMSHITEDGIFDTPDFQLAQAVANAALFPSANLIKAVGVSSAWVLSDSTNAALRAVRDATPDSILAILGAPGGAAGLAKAFNEVASKATPFYKTALFIGGGVAAALLVGFGGYSLLTRGHHRRRWL